MAGCWRLIDGDAITGFADPAVVEANVRSEAARFAALNDVLGDAPLLSESDVTIGYLANPWDRSLALETDGINPANAVCVLVRRSPEINGAVPLFFARVMGWEQQSMQAEATAVLLTKIKGFRTPPGGESLAILPFALDMGTWLQMLAGSGPDVQNEWTWDDDTGLSRGADDRVEVNLYPQGTGSPGNRGTVDIGSNNNSTDDIARQIRTGVSPRDLAYHGGKLECDAQTPLYLNGDTGISAGVKDELVGVRGKPAVIPIFESVTDGGNNAIYKIIAFQGVRVMEVKLTGGMSTKKVMIQTADVVTPGVIPEVTSGEIAGGTTADEVGFSSHIYSPVWLIR
jgi:hypothetical protein